MDAAETVFDVSLDRPLIAGGRVDEVPQLLDGVLRSAPGPKSIGGRAEVRLIDRLEHEFGRHLNDPVAQGGNAQPSDLPGPAFGDLALAHRQRGIGAVFERLSKLAQDLLHAGLLDPLARLAIDTGGPRPPVSLHPLPRDQQRRGLAEEVEQVAEARLFILDCPAVQLGLPSQYPLLGLIGRQRRERIHARPPKRRLMLRSCCPPSPCAGLSPARTSMRTPTRPVRISGHRALPGATNGRPRPGRLPRSP